MTLQTSGVTLEPPHRFNGTEFSWGEFRDNICLRYALMPHDTPAICDGSCKKLYIEHALSSPKVGLVLSLRDDTANEWGDLGAWYLIPSEIS